MISYDLPESVEVDGVTYPIRTDYRAALDILTALNDPELEPWDKVSVLCQIFYPEETPENIDDAIRRCLWFLGGGEEAKEEKQKKPKLMDWEQDFQWISAPITKALGRDIRSVKMHWWTFLSYYYEIGECNFANIVNIRRKLQKGQKLDKTEQEYYRNNRDTVDLKNRYTQEEDDLLNQLIHKG